ncbi:unnamed protein product [Macrosiphum euphorbiae]|uniref:RNA-directed DNA polymerase n=1 Tax=Macrosiphum euphorbiae TaxID=13131 RepID=A0AAV0WCE5_9HEMI|nr:unnamed protein product [Macrosiphum euphorbiae]
MSTLITILRDLLKKNVSWVWSEAHTEVLNKLKQIVASPQVLINFDPNKKITIQCDSSQTGLGCCLLQEGRPVAFSSRSLNEAEQKYPQIEKEMLSIVYACRKFHNYVYGHVTQVMTDHSPLVSIFGKNFDKVISVRLQKMKMKLIIYDLHVEYLPGKLMFIADLLSRNYLDEEENEQEIEGVIHAIEYKNINVTEIAKETENDEILKSVVKMFTEGWPKDKKQVPECIRHYWRLKENISMDQGILYYDSRIVIPSKLKLAVLKLIHEGHNGILKTLLRAKQLVYWISMDNEIRQYVNSCVICSKFRNSNIKESLIFHEIPSLPFEIVSCDVLTFAGFDFLVIADHYSKWLELIKLQQKTASEMIKQFKIVMSVHGCPRVIFSDNMPFGSMEFRTFCKEANIELNTSSPRYPQSNGMAERAVQTAKQLLRKAESERRDVSDLLLEYRCTTIPHMGAAPCELLMSRLLRTKFPIKESNLMPKVQTEVSLRQQVYKKKYKQYYDKTAKNKQGFEEGDKVMVRENSMWEPGIVKAKVANSPRSYIVQESGRVVRRTSAHLRRSLMRVGAHQEFDNDDIIIGMIFNKEDSNGAIVGENEEVRNNDDRGTEMEVSDDELIVPEWMQYLGTKGRVTKSGRVVKIPKKLLE